jgi:hypothetical protein
MKNSFSEEKSPAVRATTGDFSVPAPENAERTDYEPLKRAIRIRSRMFTFKATSKRTS